MCVCVQEYVFVFQGIRQLLLCQAHQVPQAHLAPPDPQEFQVRKLLLSVVFVSSLHCCVPSS